MKEMAMCPECDTPLISTLVFKGAEFYCLDCGGAFGFLAPRGAECTPEVEAQYQERKAEWDEHAGRKLLAMSGWHRDCEQCEPRREYHIVHATDEERKADKHAREWLVERAKRELVGGHQ